MQRYRDGTVVEGNGLSPISPPIYPLDGAMRFGHDRDAKMPAFSLMPRDPRLHPLPGDVFQDRDGLTWRVLDRFVSVDASGQEHPGVFCSVESADGDERPLCLAVSVFTAKVREHRVIERSNGADASWAGVPRLPHAKVSKLMRGQHGFD